MKKGCETMKAASGKTKGTLKAKPGAKPDMTKAGAMGGKNPDAQTASPKKSKTIAKARK